MTIDPVSKSPAQSPTPGKNQSAKLEQTNKSSFSVPTPKEDSINISPSAQRHRAQTNVQVEENRSNSKPSQRAEGNPRTSNRTEEPPSLRGSLTAYTSPEEHPKGSQVRVSA